MLRLRVVVRRSLVHVLLLMRRGGAGRRGVERTTTCRHTTRCRCRCAMLDGDGTCRAADLLLVGPYRPGWRCHLCGSPRARRNSLYGLHRVGPRLHCSKATFFVVGLRILIDGSGPPWPENGRHGTPNQWEGDTRIRFYYRHFYELKAR